METKIKVLIADAGEDYRTLLRDSLNAESDMQVVGTAAAAGIAYQVNAVNRSIVHICPLKTMIFMQHMSILKIQNFIEKVFSNSYTYYILHYFRFNCNSQGEKSWIISIIW